MNYLNELLLNGANDSHRLISSSSSSSSGSYSQIPAALFDVKVLYVKVSGCSIHEAPEILRVCFPQTVSELNGGLISPPEAAVLTLRKDRVTTESVEVTYVSTDPLRLLGSVIFEVVDDEEVLVSGTIEPSACGDGITQESFQGFESTSTGWNLDCNSVVGSPGSSFVFYKGDIAAMPPPALEIEICVVGSSLVLAQTVQLAKRRTPARCLPEDDDNRNALVMQEETEIEEGGDEMQRFYVPDSGISYIESNEGEMTWLNAGVRVGVGIGLVMCIGIGIGVGLLIQTYQATTRTFSRKLFEL